jgi:protein-S-isoprenylcysteine O-methyltransferase Ste14
MAMTPKREVVLAATASFAERYVLSAVYLYLALSQLNKARELFSGQIQSQTSLFLTASHHFTLVLLGLFTSALLLFGHRVAEPPRGFKQIVVPLITTFFNLTYFAVAWFPPGWRVNLCPPQFQNAAIVVGLTCIAIGPVIGLWGIMNLGRSFGVFISVRKVVLTGPYQWIRHPIYLGWVCFCAGLALVNFSGAYFVLITLHISLLLYRARLEEAQLASYSAEYRDSMKHTGFIFPRLRQPER